jgi:hypothetical protein
MFSAHISFNLYIILRIEGPNSSYSTIRGRCPRGCTLVSLFRCQPCGSLKQGTRSGREAQPYSSEALQWLKDCVLGRIVWCQLISRDQYGRTVSQIQNVHTSFSFRLDRLPWFTSPLSPFSRPSSSCRHDAFRWRCLKQAMRLCMKAWALITIHMGRTSF